MLYQISVLDKEIHFPCKEDETILSAMTRAGLGPIHHGCFGGGCGVCKMLVISGTVNIIKKMSKEHVSDIERNNGVVLTCCVQPRENLIIKLVS